MPSKKIEKNLSQLGSATWKNDVFAGLIGYLATVYIVVVNGAILQDAGIALETGMLATILASFFGTLIVGIYANLPLVQIPGMGINALFSYSIVKEAGLTFHEGLAVVFFASILFIIIAFTNIGNLLKESISDSLKHAISVGLGCFLILIGLENSQLVVSGKNTLIALGDFTNPTVIVSLITLVIAIYLFVKDVTANFLITLCIGTFLAYIFGILDTETTTISLETSQILKIPSFSAMSDLTFWTAVFPLTMILVFENMGLLHGQLYLLKEESEFKKGYQAIALSSFMCAFFGTSPNVSAAENAAVIASKGRTRVAAITASILFLLTIFIIPWISMIPKTAISSILIIVGFLMTQSIREIPMNDLSEALPAMLLIVMIPFTYSIADGMAFGFITYAIVKIGMRKFEDLSITFIIITLLFVVIYLMKIFGF